MIRKVIAFIVVLSAIWAIPSARNKTLHIAEPVLGRLGPVGAKASTPMKKYTARTQVAAILRSFARSKTEGKELPTQRSFTGWVRRTMPFEKKELDPWGHAYFLLHKDRTYTVGSAGPDGVKGNADDIAKTATF